MDTEDISLSDEETRKGSSLLTPVVVKRFASHVVSGVVNDLVTQLLVSLVLYSKGITRTMTEVHQA